MIIELGYAVNQTEAFPIAPAGWGLANGFCHTFPVPENWPAIELASASMDSCRSQLTWSLFVHCPCVHLRSSLVACLPTALTA